MTVSYQYEVASSTSGGFTRLLFKWRGSLWKLIYRELSLYLVAFGILSALYRHAFGEEQKRLFEKVVVYCDTFINLIPLSFVLGFYVAYVAARWWQQYMAIPWPDKMMHCVALYVNGDDETGRLARRTLMRYLNLSLVLVLRSISSAVKRRFPTLEHVVDSGFMTELELEMYRSVPSVEFNTYWIPCTWFVSLLKETRQARRITDSNGLKIIMEEFSEFRSKCGLLWSYDWVSIPLVYTQVVTIATYSFFMAALVGRQFVEGKSKGYQMEVDIYLPVFTILQFFFFMGLLKVAEQLINPFGDDDEDFELNWLIDRHIKVSYLGVDTLLTRIPPIVKDMYFNATDLTLPYTKAAVAYKKKTYRGSVHDMMVPEEKQSMFLPEIVEEEEESEHDFDGRVNYPPQRGCKSSYSRIDLASRAVFPESMTPVHSRRIPTGQNRTDRHSPQATSSQTKDENIGRSNFSSQILVGNTEGSHEGHSNSNSSVEEDGGEVVVSSSTSCAGKNRAEGGGGGCGEGRLQVPSPQLAPHQRHHLQPPPRASSTLQLSTPEPTTPGIRPEPSFPGGVKPEDSGAGPPLTQTRLPPASSRRRPSTASAGGKTRNVVRWKPLEGAHSTPYVTAATTAAAATAASGAPLQALVSMTKGRARSSLERLVRGLGSSRMDPPENRLLEVFREAEFRARRGGTLPQRTASLPDMGTPLSCSRLLPENACVGDLRRESEGGQSWAGEHRGGTPEGSSRLRVEQNNGGVGGGGGSRLRRGGSDCAGQGKCWPV
ncbi:bestrophin-2-like [Hetaerina americana]|uniref:bestrophin-2-like n=1 Tax=Hetaerina americana TaxID=62018 RepID=UPI003A7F1685